MSPCTHAESAPGTAAVARLSPKQAEAAVALARGATITRVADSLNVHRSTIYYWFKSDPLFRTAVTELQRERHERLADEMREMEALAFTALRQILQDPEAPAGVRFRTAMAVLTRPSDSIGAEAWRLPYMESIGHTLDRRPTLAEQFAFDAGRQIPDSGDSSDEIRQNSALGLNFDAPALLQDPDSGAGQEEEEEDEKYPETSTPDGGEQEEEEGEEEEEEEEDDTGDEPEPDHFVFHPNMFRQNSTSPREFAITPRYIPPELDALRGKRPLPGPAGPGRPGPRVHQESGEMRQ